MKLTVLISSTYLLTTGSFASPVTNSRETLRPGSKGNVLASRDNGLQCADHQYSSADMSNAYAAGENHVAEGTTVRSREGNRYPYRFLNKDKDGNDEVSLPSDSLCAQDEAEKYEWPILRSGNIFGTQGNKRAQNDRVIFATYAPDEDSQTVWAFCALITHEGASRPGGFTECT